MRVCNPDCSPVGVNRRDAAPIPSAVLEIVSDDFAFAFFSRRQNRQLPGAISRFAGWTGHGLADC